MVDDKRIRDKSKNEILGELVSTADPGSPVHEQQKMAILVRCTEDMESRLKELTNSINATNATTFGLNKTIVRLNWALVVATAVGAAATVILAFR
ncbi:MAG: hypothetical protein V2A79_00405 [Planctomycetota bacterium]